MIESLEQRVAFGAHHWGQFTLYTELPWDFYAVPDPALPRIQVGPVAVVYFPPQPQPTPQPR